MKNKWCQIKLLQVDFLRSLTEERREAIRPSLVRAALPHLT
jgi:hypothetical protein